jgi:hypothetical protein
MTDLANKLAEMEARARQRKRGEANQGKGKLDNRIRLPVWPAAARGTPNSVLRSSLFRASNERVLLKAVTLASLAGVVIKYTGASLTQSDLTVWEGCIHLARQHPLGTIVDFTLNGFLRSLGQAQGKRQHDGLKDSLRHLTASCVEIKAGRYTYAGSLLDEFYHDEVTGRYVLKLNPKLVDLYREGWTAIDFDQRQQLKRKPLAQWLHGYFASHAKPHPLKVQTIRELSGSTNPHQGSFKRQLRAGLDELVAVGSILAFDITNDDLVTVRTKSSKAQARHLAKSGKPSTCG